MAANFKHIFLSYCRDNSEEVTALRNDLLAAGEGVWWDQDIKGGQDWQYCIRQAMKHSYAVVLCLSKECEQRTASGIYPELLDAVEAYRQYKPGSVFLIPVRLSECEIPPVEIDATRTLDRLQHIDLFPDSRRTTGLRRLIEAVRQAPHHPLSEWSGSSKSQGTPTGRALGMTTPRTFHAPTPNASDEGATAHDSAEGGEKSSPPGRSIQVSSEILDKRTLREAILSSFNLEDLEILCADIEHDLAKDGINLAVNMEMFGGSSKANKVLKLIEYLGNRRYLTYLIEAVRRARPGIF